MNQTQSKPAAISLSILALLYLLSALPTIVAAAPRRHSCSRSGTTRHHEDAECFRSWCKKATDPQLCASIVKADPGECWKTSPEGVALILIRRAKAHQKRTVSFIRAHLSNATDAGAQRGLQHCLFGYATVGKAFDVSICQLSNPHARSSIRDALRRVDDEVTYDCQWYQPDPFPPVLGQMFKRVNRFSEILHTADQIIENALD